ncbi:MAG: hypothetical protein ABI557_09930 [Aureliella sp.]
MREAIHRSLLRSHAELTELVLIALSGNTDEKSKQKAFASGVDQYLVKPISIAVLKKALLGVAERKAQVCGT